MFGPKENKYAELLIEGENDLHFVKHFHDMLQLDLSFRINVTMVSIIFVVTYGLEYYSLE